MFLPGSACPLPSPRARTPQGSSGRSGDLGAAQRLLPWRLTPEEQETERVLPGEGAGGGLAGPGAAAEDRLWVPRLPGRPSWWVLRLQHRQVRPAGGTWAPAEPLWGGAPAPQAAHRGARPAVGLGVPLGLQGLGPCESGTGSLSPPVPRGQWLSQAAWTGKDAKGAWRVWRCVLSAPALPSSCPAPGLAPEPISPSRCCEEAAPAPGQEDPQGEPRALPSAGAGAGRDAGFRRRVGCEGSSLGTSPLYTGHSVGAAACP